MPTSENENGIDGVIRRLDEIIDRAKADGSRLGYFPALYRKVTREVKAKLGTGFFDDDQRMERLDVVFAGRYLTAFDQFARGEQPTQSWAYAFDVAGQWWPIVLQHLLLGINAHINLDLGIACAEIADTPDRLVDLRADFDRINEILGSLVGDVQRKLAHVWPPLRWFNRYLGGVEDVIINFSLKAARDSAWSTAERFVELPRDAWAAEIAQLDASVVKLSELIRYPGPVLWLVTKTVRLGEIGSVTKIIETLE